MSTCKISKVDLSEITIEQRLRNRQGSSNLVYRTVEGLNLRKDTRPAAVLIPMICDRGYWNVLFIRRTETLPEHKGQVAFPGGATEPDDLNAEETALRETYEEIGLESKDIRILGKLDEMVTNSGYLITPIVGVVRWPRLLKLEYREVARAFTIPLSWLADPSHHEERVTHRDGQERQVIYFDLYSGELLWGVSARIMVEFLVTLEL